MIAPARRAAYHALRSIAKRSTDLPHALADARRRLSDERDRALTSEIVTGSLRWQRTLEYLAAHFARRSLDALDPEVLTIVVLSLYQVLHLSRVPASAVVDDAVNLAREARKPSAAGFVNAVLRQVLRMRHRLPLPSAPSDASDRAAALAYLGITCSHPDWLVTRWLDRWGFDAAAQCVRFNNETPALTVRANTLRVSRAELRALFDTQEIHAHPTRYAPDGLVITRGNPLREHATGRFFVQDEASQLVPLALAAAPGQRVLDLCASPGGKTTEIAALMQDDGLVVASDVRARRVRLLNETVRVSGAVQVRVVHIDSAAALPFTASFDRVLVDAPCSGLGTVRRDPDIKWRRREDDLPALATAQYALLAKAATALRPGGRIVYATCSTEPEENEQVVERFLGAHPEFVAVDLRTDGRTELESLVDHRGMLRTLPFRHQLEGFFAAAMTRRQP